MGGKSLQSSGSSECVESRGAMLSDTKLAFPITNGVGFARLCLSNKLHFIPPRSILVQTTTAVIGNNGKTACSTVETTD